jgi:putative membrane protein
MNQDNIDRNPYIYIWTVNALSVTLIVVNALLGMPIPFKASFLIGYVGALMVFVIWHAISTKGWGCSLLMLASSFIVAFTAEALGVNFGWVFGSYHYTEFLGFKLFGVPLLAALAWEPIIYAAFCLTDILAPSLVDRASPWVKRLPIYVWMAGVGALATTAWDMMIDPIAVSHGWWVWHEGGSYLPYLKHGVPVQNFVGWLGVSFLIHLIYRLLTETVAQPRRSLNLSIRSPLALYLSLYLTAVGVTATVLRRPEVALIGSLAMGPFIFIALTNVNLVQRGLATLLGAGWLEFESQ